MTNENNPRGTPGSEAHSEAHHEALTQEDRELLAELPPAPPRPASKRRFQGTAQQIRGSLTFYKVAAYVTGVMLLLLVVKMVADYGFGLELYIGGTIDGESQTLGLHPEGAVADGTAVSYWIAVVHGWIYVIYIFAGFRLWFLMNWKLTRLLTIVLGGVVPFLSFVVERRIAGEVHQEMVSNPEAIRRY